MMLGLCLGQWRDYNFCPPPAGVMIFVKYRYTVYNSLDTSFGSLCLGWVPFTVFDPWDPGIAGAADG